MIQFQKPKKKQNKGYIIKEGIMDNKKCVNLIRELIEFWVNISDYKDKQKDEQEYYKAFNHLKKQLTKGE